MRIELQVKKLKNGVKLPDIAYNDKQAGIDFYLPNDIVIYAHKSLIVDLQIAIKPVYKGFFGWLRSLKYKLYTQLKSKSGIAFNNGIEVTNAGVIDEDYEDSIKVLLYNNTNEKIIFEKDTKIVQGIVFELPKVKVKEVKDFKKNNNKNHRGKRGFGSSSE